MALVEKSVLLSFSAEQMFGLVDNVADYPKFLPWCGGTSVTVIDDNKIRATVDINITMSNKAYYRECTAGAAAHRYYLSMARSAT